jgi:hypothetical protein
MTSIAHRCMADGGCLQRAEPKSTLCLEHQLAGASHPRPRKRGRPPAQRTWQHRSTIRGGGLSADNALLVCGNDHDHIVGRLQVEQIDGTACPWCGLPLSVARVGWA